MSSLWLNLSKAPSFNRCNSSKKYSKPQFLSTKNKRKSLPWPCQHVTLPLVSSKPTTSPLYAISHSLMTWDSKNYSEINNLTVKSLVLNLLIKNNSYKFISETKNVFKSGLKNSVKKSHKQDSTNSSDQSENLARVDLPQSTKSKEHLMVKHSPSKPFPKLMPFHHHLTRLP